MEGIVYMLLGAMIVVAIWQRVEFQRARSTRRRTNRRRRSASAPVRRARQAQRIAKRGVK
jgi:hypothetical protein